MPVRQAARQLRNAVKEVGSTEQIFGNFDGAGGSALPANFRPDDFAAGVRLQGHPLDDTSQEVFLFLIADAILIPVVAQMRHHLLHLLLGAAQLVRGRPVLPIGVLGCLQLEQTLIPGGFQRLRHQTIRRINRLIAATGEIGLVGEALQLFLPLSVDKRGFLLQFLRCPYRLFQRRHIHDAQEQILDQDIHTARAGPVADGRAEGAVGAITGVVGLSIMIADTHLASTGLAPHQTLK